MAAPYDSFSNDTALHIVNEFGAIIDHGTPRNVDDAFAALKKASERIRNDVIEGVENIAVRHAGLIGQDWNSIDDVKVKKKDILSDHGRSIQQLSWVLFYLNDLKKDSSAPLIKAFVEKFTRLKPSDKFENEKLSGCYGEAVNAVSQGAAPDNGPSAWNEPSVLDVFKEFPRHRERILAQIAAMDTDARGRLVAGCEEAFLNMIKLHSEGFEEVEADDLQGSLTLGKYLVAARGNAADPLLKAYVETVSALPIKEGDFFHRSEILAVAQTHVMALDTQAKLKQLADARKKRALKPAASL